MLTLEVAPTNTVGKLKRMLLDKKNSADSKENYAILGVQVLVDNRVLSDDDQTLECLGLLHTEWDVPETAVLPPGQFARLGLLQGAIWIHLVSTRR